jgi:hypothetical protein
MSTRIPWNSFIFQCSGLGAEANAYSSCASLPTRDGQSQRLKARRMQLWASVPQRTSIVVTAGYQNRRDGVKSDGIDAA